MNLYLRELKRNSKSLIIWSTISIILLAMVMAIYPTMVKEAENYSAILEGMPEAITLMFGIEELSLADIFGYYSVEGYIILTLLVSIYAIMLSGGILSKEESDKTIEFLLAKPITRREIVTSKLFAYLTNIVIFNLLLTITLFISFEAVKIEDYDMKTFIILNVAPLLLMLTFSAIGFLLSVFITKSKKILPASLGIVMVTYFLSIISGISDKLENLKYLSPFKYVEASKIIKNGRIEGKYLIIMLVINVLCIGLTYIFYNKKDISV